MQELDRSQSKGRNSCFTFHTLGSLFSHGMSSLGTRSPLTGESLFPKAVVTKFHKLDGLKLQKFILLHSGSQNPKSIFTEPKSRCEQGHGPSRGSRGESVPTSSGFWWLQVFLGLWPHHPSLCLLSVWLCQMPFTTLLQGYT